MNIRFVLFTDDDVYMTKIANGLVRIRKEFIITIRKREELFTEEPDHYDFVMLDMENFRGGAEEKRFLDYVSGADNIICFGGYEKRELSTCRLASEMAKISKKYCLISKYDSIISMYRDIVHLMSLYGHSGVSGDNAEKCCITVFTGLSGGCGCSTAALAAARMLSASGKNTFFVSMEDTVSRTAGERQTPYNMDYLVYYAASDMKRPELDIDSFLFRDDERVAHFDYGKRHNRLLSLTGEELNKVIGFIAAKDCDHLIIDSGQFPDAQAIKADHIVVAARKDDPFRKQSRRLELIADHLTAGHLSADHLTADHLSADHLTADPLLMISNVIDPLTASCENELQISDEYAEKIARIIEIPHLRAGFNEDLYPAAVPAYGSGAGASHRSTAGSSFGSGAGGSYSSSYGSAYGSAAGGSYISDAGADIGSDESYYDSIRKLCVYLQDRGQG